MTTEPIVIIKRSRSKGPHGFCDFCNAQMPPRGTEIHRISNFSAHLDLTGLTGMLAIVFKTLNSDTMSMPGPWDICFSCSVGIGVAGHLEAAVPLSQIETFYRETIMPMQLARLHGPDASVEHVLAETEELLRHLTCRATVD